jgi:hypothetical protein
MSNDAVAVGIPERFQAFKIDKAHCPTCDFEIRGDDAELVANAHIAQTNHQLCLVTGAFKAFLVRPRPPQRVLQDAAAIAETVDAVRALFREAGELNVLDAEVHDAVGTKTLRDYLEQRANELQPRGETTP